MCWLRIVTLSDVARDWLLLEEDWGSIVIELRLLALEDIPSITSALPWDKIYGMLWPIFDIMVIFWLLRFCIKVFNFSFFSFGVTKDR